MASLNAHYADYVITIGDGGKVTVSKSGQPCASAMGAIREIAAAVGFTIDPKWNTQSSGKKLVAFLNSGESSLPETAGKDTPKPMAATANSEPAPVEAQQPTADTQRKPEKKTETSAGADTITLTPEEMDRILKRLDELESRLNKLAAKTSSVPASGNPAPDGKIMVVKKYWIPRVDIYKHDESGKQLGYCVINLGYHSVILTSDGRFLIRSGNPVGGDPNTSTPISYIRDLALGLGMSVDKDTKKLTLTMQIINNFGQIVNGLYIEGDGDLYKYSDFCFEEYVGALTNQELIANEYTNEAMKVNPQWTKEELLIEIIRYISSLNKKYGNE